MPEPIDLISKGLELTEQDKFPEAELYILKGIKEYEKRKDKDGVTFALGRLGYCYEQAGQVEKAREAYEKAIQIGTDIPATYYGLISILVFAGQFDRAFEVAEVWQAKGTQQISRPAQELFVDLSSRLVRAERYNDAVQLLTRTINYFPQQKYPQVYWRIRGLIGNAYEQEGKLDEAIQLYASLVTEGSTDTFTFNRYLINLEKRKEYQTAMTVVEKALKIQKEAAWEADLKKRKQRLEQKTGAVPKGTPKTLIPDFSIRGGEQNLALIQQIQFSPQLSHLASAGNCFYGATGGKTPKLFCHHLGEVEPTWETSFEGEPAGILAINGRVILYTRDGRIGEGETNIYFYDENGKLINRQVLPDVPSEVVVSTDRVYAGCRDGNLYTFSGDGQRLWSYSLPSTKEAQEDQYSHPCPYYVAAGNDVVAFTSYGTLYALNPKGRLLFKWGTPERIEKSKTEYFTITISTGVPSAVALTVAPVGNNVLVASDNTVYELVDGKEIQKVSLKSNIINHIYWMDPGIWGVCDSEKFIIIQNGKIIAKVPVKGFSQMVFNRPANRLVVWSGNNLSVSTLKGNRLAEVEFVKSVHFVRCFDDGKILVGTRYDMLFDSNPETQKPASIEASKQPVASTDDKPILSKMIVKERLVEENGIPIRWIEAQKLTIGPGKAYYKGPNKKELTIEQFVLEQYKKDGYQGEWTENAFWWEIMALLFWDVIFAKLTGVYTPQVGEFPSKMQDMPQDFFRPEFYMRRKHLIERRIQDLTTPRVLGLVKPNIEAELKVSYQHNYGKSCRPIEDWKLFGLEQLLSSTKTLTDQQLILVMRRLLENFNENRKGLPDLFLIDATGNPGLLR
jgi:tetratricopeptide (TPR) repeat protein